MSEYSYAQFVPAGWESLRGPRDTRTFWRGVQAEVKRLYPTGNQTLVQVQAVRDRHLALDAYVKALPHAVSNPTATETGVTGTGTWSRSHALTVKHPVASAEAVLLAAALTNASVVHITGNTNSVSVATSASADSGANTVFTLTIADVG